MARWAFSLKADEVATCMRILFSLAMQSSGVARSVTG
jgi:hypothetical protein